MALLMGDFSFDRVSEARLGRLDRELIRQAFTTIGDLTYTGMGTLVPLGVSIGGGSIVRSVSVVTKDGLDDAAATGEPTQFLLQSVDYRSRRLARFFSQDQR
jgi:acetyltransferase-like isoleucine patch superfamily enzyme